MRIKIKSKLLLLLFGWGKFPSYVEADHKCWMTWFRWKPVVRGNPVDI
jgi:hypothetical protein